MKHTIYVINSSNPKHTFNETFATAAAAQGATTAQVRSIDCVLSVDTNNNVELIHDNQSLIDDSAHFFIKSYKDDAYLTYLIGNILAHKQVLFTDGANLFSANSADKMTMMALLPLHGISVPATILCTPHSYTVNKSWIDDRIQYPCVIKKTGSKGKQVWKVNNEAELLEKLTLDEELTLIQEYIPCDFDLRVIVFDQQVLTTIKRTSADGFYNNVSQGGTASLAELSDAEKQICIQAAAVAKLEIAGVDLIYKDGAPYILEVNKNPQLTIFNDAAGIDIEKVISEKIVKTILS